MSLRVVFIACTYSEHDPYSIILLPASPINFKANNWQTMLDDQFTL